MMPSRETPLKFYKTCPNCQTNLVVDHHQADCPNCEFIYYLNPAPCVSVIIENDDQSQLLWAKRAIQPHMGEWDIIGGFIDPGESSKQAAIREVKEETGLDVEIVTQLGDTIPDVYGQAPTLIFPYLARINGGQLQAQDDVGELKWFDFKQSPALAFASATATLERYLASKNGL